jgi:hypothetical protein
MWTQERVTRLQSLWASGASAQEISWEIGGCTRNAVLGKLHRLGLLGTRLKPNRRSPRRVIRPRERRERPVRVKPNRHRHQPQTFVRRPVAPVQTKSEIAAEFAQIWANTVAIQNAGRTS